MVDAACGAQAKAWPRCAVTMAMGQGARHLGSSLAPATGKSLAAGAICASSLPAGAGVVTTLLAQGFRLEGGRPLPLLRDGWG